MSRRCIFFCWLSFILLAGVASCSGVGSSMVTTEEPATASLTATPPPALTVCLGEEPDSLYLYAPLSPSAREVLSAIYDGPIDSTGYGFQPVILEKLPSLEDGDAVLESVSMYIGDEVVDAEGNPITLEAGVRVRPSGCREDECIITYTGIGEISMDQMVVNFSLLPDLTWADGEPLTADDSVFSFTVAADPETPGSKFLFERTQAYEAVDDLTVQWWGKPGFIDPTYFVNFWSPLPRHAWEEYSAAELPAEEIANSTPLGWGPYVIDEWSRGDHIRLVRNPRYFRAGEGLPSYDVLVYRFTPGPEEAISMLLDGECDLLADSITLDDEVGLLLAAEEQGILQLQVAQTMSLERIDFGLRPAEYDDGFSLPAGDRPDFFRDQRTRQAIALCMDRQQVVDGVLFGLTEVADSMLPPSHPFHDPDLAPYEFNVAQASLLLDQAGWRDHDAQPSSPRRAEGVAGVPDGTSLELDLWTTNTAQRRQVSEILASSLEQCGIGVQLQYYDYADLFAAGPAGPLFGRRFELVELAMGTNGPDTPCEWFISSEIPNEVNQWAGTNISGFDRQDYDTACTLLGGSLRDQEAYQEAYRTLQSLLWEDLPFIPLFWRFQVLAYRPGLCGPRPDATATSDLWNIEAWGEADSCRE